MKKPRGKPLGFFDGEEINCSGGSVPRHPIRTHFSLGLVGAPFGLKGFVKVRPFSGETGHFFRLDKVILRLGEKEETREVAEILSAGSVLHVRFAGVESVEAAKSLLGAEIIVKREYAAPLKEGEYYVEDLKGLEVVNTGGEGAKAFGFITDVIEGGGGDLAEVELKSGERRLVPFRKEFLGDVDLKKGKIILLEPWILE